MESGVLARAGGGAERPDDVHGQAGRMRLQETVLAIGDVIRVQASEMRKIHDARELAWDVEHAGSGRPGAGP